MKDLKGMDIERKQLLSSHNRILLKLMKTASTPNEGSSNPAGNGLKDNLHQSSEITRNLTGSDDDLCYEGHENRRLVADGK